MSVCLYKYDKCASTCRLQVFVSVYICWSAGVQTGVSRLFCAWSIQGQKHAHTTGSMLLRNHAKCDCEAANVYVSMYPQVCIYIRMSHGTHRMNTTKRDCEAALERAFTHVNGPRHTYKWVVAHAGWLRLNVIVKQRWIGHSRTWVSHITHVIESRYTQDQCGEAWSRSSVG